MSIAHTHIGHEDLPVSDNHLHLHEGFKTREIAMILEGNCSSVTFDDDVGDFSIEREHLPEIIYSEWVIITSNKELGLTWERENSVVGHS